MIVTKKKITIRGLLRDSIVEAMCFGDWCVHRQLAYPEKFCITLMPIGLSLPLTWASFDHSDNALGAMQSIARLRNSWSQVTQEDLTKKLEDQLRAICLRFGAREGSVQITQDCDKNMLGLATRERLNGYHHPGVK